MRTLDGVRDKRFSSLTPRSKAALVRLMCEPARCLMPHEVAIAADLSYEEAFELFIGLGIVGAVSLYILVYHMCSEAPVDKIPITQGIPRFGYCCPNCGLEVENTDVLELDLEATVLTPIAWR